MRTPNATCIVCAKPLYRRPAELARVRYVACLAHRAEAQRISGITGGQRSGLSLGRAKGTNHRRGYRHSDETRAKIAATNQRFFALNPQCAIARGAKTRGAAHYNWSGGVSNLNLSIRQMRENRRWMDAVKARDGRCVRCGLAEGIGLEAHHRVPLSELIERLGIRNRDDARRHAGELWSLDNGETLCVSCHFREHGREYAAS